MAQLPHHPDSGVPAPDTASARRTSWPKILGIAGAVIAIAIVVVLHLTGVLGPGGHSR